MKWQISQVKKYFVTVGLLFNIIMILSLVFIFHKVYSSGLSLPLFSSKVKAQIMISQPNLYKLVAPALTALSYFEIENYYFRHLDLSQWSGKGAHNRNSSQLSTNKIDSVAVSQTIVVNNTSSFILALKTVKAGQTIIMSPGSYYVTTSRVNIHSSGTKNMPIHLTAQELGTVTIFLQGEGIVVDKPHWHFSNLHIIGNCNSHSQCEHAFHVVGKGEGTVIKNNVLQDFNAMIKVNGIGNSYPDHGRVTNNTFFNRKARNTTNPVTPFDLMHANDWQVSDNFFFDIQKSGGDKISYAAFFKGGSEYGVFERNLVICAANLPKNYTSIGLSLGGGGSRVDDRRNKSTAEHVGGVIRNNIIMHCSNDVGIYINRGRDSLIEHNILYNTLGIDVRYSQSNTKITNNIISGRIKKRDNANVSKEGNIVVARNFITGKDGLSDYFIAPDIGDFNWRSPFYVEAENDVLAEGTTDFCQSEIKQHYVGAFSAQYFCIAELSL